jgi:hypothetical protein
MNWFGCALTILGIILVIFILTHIPEIWSFLERLISWSGF